MRVFLHLTRCRHRVRHREPLVVTLLERHGRELLVIILERRGREVLDGVAKFRRSCSRRCRTQLEPLRGRRGPLVVVV